MVRPKKVLPLSKRSLTSSDASSFGIISFATALSMAFLFSLNLLAGGVGIALFIALSWGIGLSLQGWRAYQSSGFRYQRDF